jgi:hypothetical protein
VSRRKLPELRRRVHRREPKRRFTLICEGDNTEPIYFQTLKRLFSKALIQVEIVAGAGVPRTIAELAVEKAKEIGLWPRRGKRKDSFEEKDEIWAVFDRDAHPKFDEAVNHCEAHGVNVARSNPCFEVWLILHVMDYDRPDGRHTVQQHLGRIRPEYDSSRRKIPNCAELISSLEEAEVRAERQMTRRENEGRKFGPPSTTVGLLTRTIRKAAELS